MYKLVVLAAVLAVAAAKPAPGLLAYSALPAVHSGVVAGAPLAYSAYSAPLAYSAYSAPIAAPVAAPVAYSLPSAYSYVSGHHVSVHAEPVEQHGYKIVY